MCFKSKIFYLMLLYLNKIDLNYKKIDLNFKKIIKFVFLKINIFFKIQKTLY